MAERKLILPVTLCGLLAVIICTVLLSESEVRAGSPPSIAEHFFDGSMQRKDAGEAAVDRNQGPGYYHFTLEGLSALTSLRQMRVAVVPHEGHTSRRMDIRVWTSLPASADEEVAGYDFSFREEKGLVFNYYDADGELIEEEVLERDINQTGWIEVPLDGLSMEDARTFRMSFDHGFRGSMSIPSVEVTGILEDGGEAVTLVRYDFDREGSRAVPNKVHRSLQASVMWPQGYPLPEPQPATERPDGEYSMVKLHFDIPDGPGSFRNWHVIAGMRGNRIPMDQWTGITEPGGELTLNGGHLQGAFDRQHRGEMPHNVVVDARVEGGAIRGKVTVDDEHTGTVSGSIVSEPQLRNDNAMNREAVWPSYHGPVGHGMAGEMGGRAPIAEPEDIRFQWRQEAIDVGQSIGSLNRFAYNFTSARKRTGSASAGPVVADGRVYLYYSVPNPDIYNYYYRASRFTHGHSAFERAAENMAEQGRSRELFDGDAEDLPTWALEKIWEAADDVVICMDAETGRTLWRTRISGVGYNRQHHKSGPYAQTPGVANGRVFAVGSGGHLYGLDAETGELLWSNRIGHEHSHQGHSVLALPEVVVVPKGGNWAGFDPDSGEKLWSHEDSAINSMALPPAWRDGDGNAYIFLPTRGNGSDIACVRADTGQTAWKYPMSSRHEDHRVTFAVSGRGANPGGMIVHGDILLTQQEIGEDDQKEHALVAYDLTAEGATERWRQSTGRVRGSHNPVIVADRWVALSPVDDGVQIYNLDTGEMMAEADGEHPGGNGQLMAAGDLVIVQRDMTHGNIELTFYRVDDDGKVTNLNPDQQWRPPYGQGTTSYHHPIMHPIVDGRLLLRQRDGLYAYDLRAQE